MVTYTCYADGGPGNTYEWLRLRDNSVVSSMQELTLDNTNPLDGGDYQCTITNNAGETTAMTTLNGEHDYSIGFRIQLHLGLHIIINIQKVVCPYVCK